MSDVDLLKERIARREYTVGVIGLGYVGLPLVLRFGEVGFRVIGFDVDVAKVRQLNGGTSYIQHVPAARVSRPWSRAGRFEATTDSRASRRARRHHHLRADTADRSIASRICATSRTRRTRSRPRCDAGQLVCLESTTYPGTTDEVVLPQARGRAA